MGRTQTFDTDEAVRAARAVFWRHGYEDASLSALEDATGLGRSSLYHAFGSKRGLFDAAVRSYLDEVIRPRLRPLTTAPVSPEAIVDYFRGLRGALAAPDTLSAHSGCLLLNAAGAPISQDAAVRDAIAGYRAELHRALGTGVSARWPDRASDERERLARVCTALLITALVLARVDTTSALESVDTALELLDHEAPAPVR